ncbi:MAG: decarboxylase [Patescibacteria group bacterium]
MSISNLEESKKRLLKLLETSPERSSQSLVQVVQDVQQKGDRILQFAEKYETPFYLLDQDELKNSILRFQNAFFTFFPSCKPFYAMKSDHHPFILQTVLQHGFGLDVSSERELNLALEAGAKNILFSGPGKTLKSLSTALDHADTVTVNIDSFSELRKLGKLSEKKKIRIRAGVRFFSSFHGAWSKFGIPLSDLKYFWEEARQYSFLDLCGIQFHISWNRDPSKYVQILKELSEYLRANFSPEMLKKIDFIDFGGGFFPNQTEGYYPWTSHYPGSLPTGALLQTADNYFGVKTPFDDKYFVTNSVSLEQFAQTIAGAVKEYLDPLLQCDYYSEPGRIISNNSMHIVTRVVDVKNPQCVIADGGVNAVGWEYGEHFYYPLINLTHPSLKEIDCTVYGPLCTPHDIWGYYSYATQIEENDVIVVPYQGAYKYVLSQEFINPVPKVYILPSQT